MTLQEQIKSLPEPERTKFFRMLMVVCAAGQEANVPAQDFAKVYADTIKQVKENT
jgi:hypothetical protein